MGGRESEVVEAAYKNRVCVCVCTKWKFISLWVKWSAILFHNLESFLLHETLYDDAMKFTKFASLTMRDPGSNGKTVPSPQMVQQRRDGNYKSWLSISSTQFSSFSFSFISSHRNRLRTNCESIRRLHTRFAAELYRTNSKSPGDFKIV